MYIFKKNEKKPYQFSPTWIEVTEEDRQTKKRTKIDSTQGFKTTATNEMIKFTAYNKTVG